MFLSAKSLRIYHFFLAALEITQMQTWIRNSVYFSFSYRSTCTLKCNLYVQEILNTIVISTPVLVVCIFSFSYLLHCLHYHRSIRSAELKNQSFFGFFSYFPVVLGIEFRDPHSRQVLYQSAAFQYLFKFYFIFWY